MNPVHLVCPHCNATNRVPSDKLQAELNCGQCHKPLLAAHPDNLGEAAFNAQLAKSDLPMVVDFWAPWCGPCRMMAPAYTQVAAQLKLKARLAKLDTEAEPAIATRYAIRSIPTLIAFSNGREVARQSGALDATVLLAWIKARFPAL